MTPEELLEQHQKMLRASKWKAPKLRSTLTSTQAASILPFIEVALTGKDVLLEYDVFSVRPITLYHKLCDAFQWYVRYDKELPPEKRTAISALRVNVYFPYDEDNKGIWIRHKRSTKHVPQQARPMPAAAAIVAQLDSIQWREDFMTWVESSKPGDCFERNEGVILSAEDIEFVKAVTAALDCKKCDVTSVTISCQR